MRTPGTVLLMYHRVSEAGALPDEGDYALPTATFEEQVRWLAARGPTVVPLRGITEKMQSRDAVVLTFDDGCETDATVAAPLLLELGLPASFFVPPSTIGAPGFLSWEQLEELAECGFEIGSHGLDHHLFGDLTDDELSCQLAESKRLLEDRLGRCIEALSLPGGSGGRRALTAAHAAGYRRVLGSRPGVVRDAHSERILPRYVVRSSHSLAAFQNAVQRHPMTRWHRSARYLVGSVGRSLMGITKYERLRAERIESRSAAQRTGR